MNNNRKNMGILIVSLGVIIIILIIYFGFLKKTPTGTDLNIPVATTTAELPYSLPASTATSTPEATQPTYDISKEAPHQVDTEDLGKIAMAFSERLGSFSNQSGYNNITDLKIFMTESMKTWADSYITQLTEQYKNNGTFYGITTHSLLFKVDSFDDQKGAAKITVTTQRDEQGGVAAYNQDIDLGFSKVNGEWLVNEAYWIK